MGRGGALTVGLTLTLALNGCGGGSSPSFDAAQLERELPGRFDATLVKMTDVSCVPKSDRVFQCIAMVTPTMRAIRQEYRGVGMTRADLALVRRQESGRVSYEVTVDPETGKFVAKAEG